ncbi:MAG: hypothetical protein IKJ09_05830 [Bacteroidaceae bacterium]|nr:hypothetical protein [Bacteroidaceae bacterium]
MRKNEIIHLIESNIKLIESSEEKCEKIISLLEAHKPIADIETALVEGGEELDNTLSALTDITPYVVSGIKGYIMGTEMMCVPTNSISVSDAEEINETLGYIYKKLK